MKIFNKLTNGIVIIIIAIMHTQFCFSEGVFGKQFHDFSKTYFFEISKGTNEFPIAGNCTIYETHAAFWFFYFGILLIPIGLLLHTIERKQTYIPHSFTISYLLVVLIGVYMIPESGMTFFMLPHAVFMLIRNYVKYRKVKTDY